MKKYIIALSLALAIGSYNIHAADTADIDDEIIQWAQAPVSRCTTPQQKMKCAFAQQTCKALDSAAQEKINKKRAENRIDADYTLPLLAEEDTKITPKKTAVFLSLVKTKAVDMQ